MSETNQRWRVVITMDEINDTAWEINDADKIHELVQPRFLKVIQNMKLDRVSVIKLWASAITHQTYVVGGDDPFKDGQVEEFLRTLYDKLLPVNHCNNLVAELVSNPRIGFDMKDVKFELKFVSCVHNRGGDSPYSRNGLLRAFQLTDEETYAALTGLSGSGKTSLMKWMLDKMSKDDEKKVISIYLTAGYPSADLFHSIVQKIREQLQKTNPDLGDLIGNDTMKSVHLVVGIDEVSLKWGYTDYCTLSKKIKDRFNFGSVKTIVGGTDLTHEVSTNNTCHLDVYKIRMVPIKKASGKELVAWHLVKDGVLDEDKAKIFVEKCEQDLRHFSALVTNHRCAMSLAKALGKLHEDQFIKDGNIRASSYFIIHEVAHMHLTMSGFQGLEMTNGATHRILLDALTLVATQPHRHFVDTDNTDAPVQKLLEIGIIERAVQNRDDGRVITINGFEWEMSPAITLLATITLVPEFLTPTDPSERLEVLGALHISLLRYAHTGFWRKVIWLDRPVPFATIGNVIYEPDRATRRSNTLINGGKAPYADVISIGPKQGGEDDEDNESALVLKVDESEQPMLSEHCQKFPTFLASNIALSGSGVELLPFSFTIQIKSSKNDQVEASPKEELNKMGIVRHTIPLVFDGSEFTDSDESSAAKVEAQSKNDADQAELNKKFIAAEHLNKRMFGNTTPIACFLTNALFKPSDCAAMKSSSDTWHTIIVQGGQNPDGTTNRGNAHAWECMYPLVDIFSFNARTKPTTGALLCGKYNAAKDKVTDSTARD